MSKECKNFCEYNYREIQFLHSRIDWHRIEMEHSLGRHVATSEAKRDYLNTILEKDAEKFRADFCSKCLNNEICGCFDD